MQFLPKSRNLHHLVILDMVNMSPLFIKISTICKKSLLNKFNLPLHLYYVLITYSSQFIQEFNFSVVLFNLY